MRIFMRKVGVPVGHYCAGSADPEEHIGDEHVLLVASVQAVGHLLMIYSKCPLPGESLHHHGMLARVSAPDRQSAGASSSSAEAST